MSYILKQFDTNLLHFDMQKDIDGVSAKILSVNGDKSLLPLDLELSDRGLAKWLKRRTIPQNRAYVQNFLAKVGLNEKDTKGIIDFCKGLSPNDCYWVLEEDLDGSFAENNLYNNRFSNVLSHIAFTGYGSFQKSSLRSSPEFTTNGMLAKCWRRVDGKIVLYKSGTEGFLQDWETYAKTRVPATYSDFTELAKQLMWHSQKEKLRKLINFKKHPRYNWSDNRLKTIALMLNNHVCFLLDNMF